MRQIETAVSYDERKIAFFSSDEKKWINKMRKLALTLTLTYRPGTMPFDIVSEFN